MGMGIPSTWHRRQAMMLAAQLPENLADAKLIMEAVQELLDTFLVKAPDHAAEIANNILPFVSG
jgi:hypothetical protein